LEGRINIMARDLPKNQSSEADALPPTRADWVEQQLRRDILFGVYAPGERLLAADLAKRYTVSLTPLREALQRLAADGLIAMTPQRGVRVTQISLRSAQEIYELRCLLEPLALRKSLSRVDEEWRKDVQQTYEHLIAVLNDENHAVVTGEDANRAFHIALLSRCDSRWLLNMVTMLFDHCIRYRFLSFNERGGREGLLDEHRAIYEASMRGDIDTAAQALEYHIGITLKSLVTVLQETAATEEED
jgi:GntR family carbon starvation induced transcriptional regulator